MTETNLKLNDNGSYFVLETSRWGWMAHESSVKEIITGANEFTVEKYGKSLVEYAGSTTEWSLEDEFNFAVNMRKLEDEGYRIYDSTDLAQARQFIIDARQVGDELGARWGVDSRFSEIFDANQICHDGIELMGVDQVIEVNGNKSIFVAIDYEVTYNSEKYTLRYLADNKFECNLLNNGEFDRLINDINVVTDGDLNNYIDPEQFWEGLKFFEYKIDEKINAMASSPELKKQIIMIRNSYLAIQALPVTSGNQPARNKITL